eukprot:TRINITY_DN8328_c0_g1_i1.p1 TRINITY_DN8328_c0_g1~~TRINITY_DN8328_c0_g1_i1.p1  ORF type:complete len:2109 (+),score=672.20 TRINITY_DN8328_c0_g1_i1:54-6380(+)
MVGSPRRMTATAEQIGALPSEGKSGRSTPYDVSDDDSVPGSDRRRPSVLRRPSGVQRSGSMTRAVPPTGEEEDEETAPAFDFEKEWPRWRLKVRRFVRTDRRFDSFILFVILLCTVTLALEDPTDTTEEKWTTRLVRITDSVFTVIFSVEAALKMVALGFFVSPWSGPDPPAHEGGYFRNWWNILDFTICVTGFFQLAGLDKAGSRAVGRDSGGGDSSFNGLRAFRLLRPLRAVSRFPSVRILVNSLLASLPRLSSVFLLYSVFLFVFGVIALQVWQGRLRKRCVDLVVPGLAEAAGMSVQAYRAALIANETTGGENGEKASYLFIPELRDQVCKEYPKGEPGRPETLHGGQYCPWRNVCVEIENPNLGQEHFDNIGAAVLTLFVAVTMEGWTALMYRVIDASSYYSALFFVVLIMFGSFFIINLTLVIINAAFEYQHARELKALQEQQEMKRMERAKAKEQRRMKRARRVSVQRRQSTYTERRFSTFSRRFSVFTSATEDAASVAGDREERSRWQRLKRWLKGNAAANLRAGDLCLLLSDGTWTECRVLAVHGEYLLEDKTADVEILSVSGAGARVHVPLDSLRVKPENPIRRRTWEVICHSYFNSVITGCILLNSLALAVDHHPQSDSLESKLNVANIVFTVIFGTELLFKLLALGVWDYFADGWNVFDAIVVTTSVIELSVLGSAGNVSALRALRILRVIKIARGFESLQRWVVIILKSLRASFTLSVLIFLLMFVFGLLGMQLMGNKFCGMDTSCQVQDPTQCECKPRANFDNIGAGLLSMFQVLTGEDWNIIMYNGMKVSGPAVALFFVSFYFIGNYLTLNLFVAIFLNQASQENMSPEKPSGGGGSGSKSFPTRLRVTCPEDETLSGVYEQAKVSANGLPTWRNGEARIYSTDMGSWCIAATELEAENNGGSMQSDEHLDSSPDRVPRWFWFNGHTWVPTRADVTVDVELVSSPFAPNDKLVPLILQKHTHADESEGVFGRTPSFSVGPDHALCCLSPMNSVRIRIIYIVDNPMFELLVVLVIITSTIGLALEEARLPPDHPRNRVLMVMDYATTAVFVGEAAMKVIAFGFVMHPTSYLRRDIWNVLDFSIVVVSLISFAAGSEGIDLNIFKIFRALRPLRFINKSTGLKVVVVSLVRSLSAMANVTVISLLIYCICAIMFTQLFKGLFYQCSKDAYGDLSGVIFSEGGRTYDLDRKEDCEAAAALPGRSAYRWKNFPSHFDNVAASALTLFEMTTLEGWVTTMYLGMDGVSHERAPIKNHRPYMALFFIMFIVVGSFFVVNLFVSVLLDSYYNEKKKRGGDKFLLSEAQKKWVDGYNAMLKGAARPPHFHYKMQGMLPGLAQRMVKHRAFEPFIQVCICVNVLVMACEYYGQPRWWERMQDAANLIFIVIFTAEAAVKVLAYAPRAYIESPWNRFDMFVVILSWVGFAVAQVGKGELGTAVSVFRILRLARLLRMFRKAKGITMLLRTLLLSLPSMINVAGILFIIFFIFAVLGVKLFGRVGPGEGLDKYTNFENFVNAFLTLIRMATGEGWQVIMADCRRHPPDCDEALGQCGTEWAAILYFVLFSLCGMYVLLNLFIAVILDSFDEVVKKEQKTNSLNVQHMNVFNAAWQRFDTDRTFRIDVLLVPSLLRAIGPPLGVVPTSSYQQAADVAATLELDVVDGKVDMQPLLQSLFMRMQGHPEELDLPEQEYKRLQRYANKRFQARQRDSKYVEMSAEVTSVRTAMGVIKAQARFRGILARRQLREFKRTGMKPRSAAPRFGAPPASPALEESSPLRRAKTMLLSSLSRHQSLRGGGARRRSRVTRAPSMSSTASPSPLVPPGSLAAMSSLRRRDSPRPLRHVQLGNVVELSSTRPQKQLRVSVDAAEPPADSKEPTQQQPRQNPRPAPQVEPDPPTPTRPGGGAIRTLSFISLDSIPKTRSLRFLSSLADGAEECHRTESGSLSTNPDATASNPSSLPVVDAAPAATLPTLFQPGVAFTTPNCSQLCGSSEAASLKVPICVPLGRGEPRHPPVSVGSSELVGRGQPCELLPALPVGRGRGEACWRMRALGSHRRPPLPVSRGGRVYTAATAAAPVAQTWVPPPVGRGVAATGSAAPVISM